MPNTRDDLSIAYRALVKSQGGKAALQSLKKATGVESVDEVADDKIDGAIAALQPKAPIKTLEGLHAHMNNLASDIYEISWKQIDHLWARD